MLKTRARSASELRERNDQVRVREAIDWRSYSSRYDLLAEHNPSYEANIELVTTTLRDLDLGPELRVVDIGAGTGNFVLALAALLPGAQFVHVDSNEEMCRIARQKYESAMLSNVQIVAQDVGVLAQPKESADLVLCVNALYAMRDPRLVLERVYSWLKPNGYFVVIDIGRRTRVLDWAAFILGEVYRRRGMVAVLRLLSRGGTLILQNARGGRAQAEGRYWLHSSAEFEETLRSVGFTVRDLRTCYREYADFALCQKPGPSEISVEL